MGGREGRGRRASCRWCRGEERTGEGLRRSAGERVEVAGTIRVSPGFDLITHNSQAWERPLLTLVFGDVNQRSGAAGLGLGRAEHLFVGFELELESAVAVCQHVVLGLGSSELLLGSLVLLLQRGDQLLQLHAANLRLQLLGQLRVDLLLADEVHDDGQHEVNQVDCTLHDVLLGLRQALGRVPPGTLQEEVVNTAVELAVKLAEVLASVALSNAVLLSLVIRVRGAGAALALASAKLLQRRLAVDVLRGNQGHNLVLREIIGPLSRGSLLSCECFLPGALSRVGRRGRSRSGLVARPGSLELEGITGAGGAGSEGLLGLEGVERPAWQRLQTGQGRQAAILADIGSHHAGGSGFQRAELISRGRLKHGVYVTHGREQRC